MRMDADEESPVDHLQLGKQSYQEAKQHVHQTVGAALRRFDNLDADRTAVGGSVNKDRRVDPPTGRQDGGPSKQASPGHGWPEALSAATSPEG